MSSALAGGFLTTVPPGKSLIAPSSLSKVVGEGNKLHDQCSPSALMVGERKLKYLWKKRAGKRWERRKGFH